MFLVGMKNDVCTSQKQVFRSPRLRQRPSPHPTSNKKAKKKHIIVVMTLQNQSSPDTLLFSFYLCLIIQSYRWRKKENEVCPSYCCYWSPRRCCSCCCLFWCIIFHRITSCWNHQFPKWRYDYGIHPIVSFSKQLVTSRRRFVVLFCN